MLYIQSRALTAFCRHSSSSSKRWVTRQGKDRFAREARVDGLKSRAAYKLLEINERYRIFKRGQTVVDLGYAPGSWSQVAADRTAPGGRVIGVDIIPAQPPKGVSTIQGNFLSREVREEVKNFLLDQQNVSTREEQVHLAGHDGQPEADVILAAPEQSYIDYERELDKGLATGLGNDGHDKHERMVDVVLSDMSEPWERTDGFYKNSLSNPYFRMMNTSGMSFRDHAGSMDLCHAALQFVFDTLRDGGHFVCKYYQGAEEKSFEAKLKRKARLVSEGEDPGEDYLFGVNSDNWARQQESKEAYFVALNRKRGAVQEDVFRETLDHLVTNAAETND
ncbi:MAG: 2' O-ribose methyltransferase [Icmadophila ericetorum]|nr:2' O-ribose methyltransferase [Icmadophila ericetorum]